jgi:hypothetical protein
MAYACAGARLKIERANKHFRDLEEVLAGIPNLYTVSVQTDSQDRGHRIEHDVPNLEEIRNNLALIIGDCIHNLKTALDFIWAETLMRTAPGIPTGHLKFPIFETSKYLEDILRDRKIDTLNPALFRLMTVEIKAYRTGNGLLWSLHKLDLTDKHRLLLPLVQRAGISGITVKDKFKEITGGTWSLSAPPPYRIDIPATHEIKHKGKLSLSIVLDKGTPLQGFEVSQAVTLLVKHVKQIVQRLEAVV